jgi:hypothetical protein
MKYVVAVLVAISSFGCQGKSYLGEGETSGGDEAGAGGVSQSEGGSAGEAPAVHAGGADATKAEAGAGSVAPRQSTGGHANTRSTAGASGGGPETTIGGRENVGSLAGAGGEVATGGTAPVGGGGRPPVEAQGGAAGAVSAPLPYPWDPTLPLDPDCTCSSSDEVCNAAGQCVPRCDEAGRCAAWLVSGPVQSLYAGGSTLYFTTPPETDPLGNPVTKGTLWRVEDSDAQPERVSNAVGAADNLPDYLRIVGRNGDATYIVAGWEPAVYEVTDAGAARALATSSEDYFLKVVVTSSAVFYTTPSGLWRTRYEGDAPPEQMIPFSGETPLLQQLGADEQVWYATGTELYVFDPESTPDEAAGKGITFSFLGFGTGPSTISYVEGGVMLVDNDYGNISSCDENGNKLLLLFSAPRSPVSTLSSCQTGYATGWLFAWCQTWDGPFAASLVRAPTTVGRLPQEVLPSGIASPAGHVAGYPDYIVPIFAVGDAEVFWVQGSEGEPLFEPGELHYIFRTALPAQPCDEALPCQKAGERCGDDGLCAK